MMSRDTVEAYAGNQARTLAVSDKAAVFDPEGGWHVLAKGHAENFNLTPREQDVLAGLLMGITNRQIAGSLGIAVDTVKTHLRSVFLKTHVTNRVKLVADVLERACAKAAVIPGPSSSDRRTARQRGGLLHGIRKGKSVGRC